MKTTRTALLSLILQIVISAVRGADLPIWLAGNWTPQVREIVFDKPTEEQQSRIKEKDAMGILAQMEMFSHCQYITITGTHVILVFDQEKSKNSASELTFEIESSSDSNATITLQKGKDRWSFSAPDDSGRISMRFGPELLAKFPLKKK